MGTGMLPRLPDQVRRKALNPSRKSYLVYMRVSHNKYLVVKTIGGVSIMDLDIFEVDRKVDEACQRDPRITPQRDGSEVKVSSPDKSGHLCVFWSQNTQTAQGYCLFPKSDEVF